MFAITDKGHEIAREIDEARDASELILVVLERHGELPENTLQHKTGLHYRKMIKACESLRAQGLIEGSQDGMGTKFVQMLKGGR